MSRWTHAIAGLLVVGGMAVALLLGEPLLALLMAVYLPLLWWAWCHVAGMIRNLGEGD